MIIEDCEIPFDTSVRERINTLEMALHDRDQTIAALRRELEEAKRERDELDELINTQFKEEDRLRTLLGWDPLPAPAKERPRCIEGECFIPGDHTCSYANRNKVMKDASLLCTRPGGPVPKEEAKPPVVEVGQVWVHKRSGERLLIIPRESVDRMKTACKDGVYDPDADFGYRCLSGAARGTEGAVRPSGLLRYYTIEPRIPNPALVQARHDLRRVYDESCENLTREFMRLMGLLDRRGE